MPYLQRGIKCITVSISLTEFVKFYPLRSKGLAWFFGAGSSFSAGVPTAYDLIWDLKRRIYCAEQSYSLSLYKNLTDAAIRERIQNYFDSQGNCPPFDSMEEYSYYFERAFPSARDRSEYIVQQTSGMQLSHGHKAIGILLKNHLLNLIFTTNFDKAFENIASNNFQKVESWFTADLDNSDIGMKHFQAGKRPIIVKLHGDYFSDNLKNTSEELQNQDEKLREILSLALDTNGLCVMGYSGRDNSVIKVLQEAVERPNSFPNGLFWFQKSGVNPIDDVLNLIEQAKLKGKHADIVEIETFDTAWSNIIKGFDCIPQEDLDHFNDSYLRINNQPLPPAGRKYPLVRFNALPILQYPNNARIFKCNIGGAREVKDALDKHNSPIIAIRRKFGIVGFGDDEDFKKAFEGYGAHEMDLYPISDNDLMYDDTSTKELITNAVLKALCEGEPLRSAKRRGKYFIFPNPKKLNEPLFSTLKKTFGVISGNIQKTKLTWIVALQINIQYAKSQPFLIISPTILASKTSEKSENTLVAPFIKEFTARWYNQKYDEILNAWIKVLFKESKELKIIAFPSMSNGVNAAFKLSRTTAFTRTN